MYSKWKRKHAHKKHRGDSLCIRLTHKIKHLGTYTVRGRINMAGINGAAINVSVAMPDGSLVTGNVVTTETGAYLYSFTASQAGVYTITVSYAGDVGITASTAIASIVVKAVSTLTLVPPTIDVKVGDTVSMTGMLSI